MTVLFPSLGSRTMMLAVEIVPLSNACIRYAAIIHGKTLHNHGQPLFTLH